SFLLIFIISYISYSQNGSIKGIISDNNKSPLFGVNISIKNTLKGTQSDENGYFEIPSLENRDFVLSISYLGFKTKEVPVSITNGQTLDLGTMILYEGNEILSEVVVEGERINKFSR